LFVIIGENFADAIGNTMGVVLFRFRENEGEFIAAVARGGINGAAMNAEDIGKAADGAAANEVAIAIVDSLQAIEVEKQHGEGPAGAIGALCFILEDIEQSAVIGQASEWVANGQMVDLLEQASVVEKSATESDGVAQHHEGLGKDERSVEKAGGLRGRELGGDIQPSRGVDGAVESGVFHGQAAAVPDEAHQENGAGQQLLWIGEERAGVAGDFRRQAAKRSREHVGERDGGQQRAGDFAARVTRTREKAFDKKRHDEQKCQDHPAEPPSDRRPEKAQRGVRKKLKEEDAGRREDSAGKKKAGAENQRNAVLRSLKTHESYGRKNERKKTAYDQQITLKNNVGLNSDATKPESGKNNKKKRTKMSQENGGVTAAVGERSLAHGFSKASLFSPGRAPT